MSFAHPLLLLGMLAALIPLLVHLFDRRRPRTQPFAPLSFVLRSQRRTASRLKLRRLLLYALRTFLFLAFPIALARPECTRPAAAATVQRGPAATAIVLDASLSMRYREGETLFERGRGEVRAAIAQLSAGDPVTLLLCGGPPGPRRAPSLNRRTVLAELDAAQPSYGVADQTRCLEQAARAVEESPLAAKRLVIVSDFTARSFPQDVPLPAVSGPDGRPVRPEVVLRDVAAGKSVLPNHAVVGLRVEPAAQAGPRTYQFTFSVQNHSPEAIHDVTAVLKVGETVVARGFVDVAAGGTGQKVFTHRFEQGGFTRGEVVLAPDALPEDDRQTFALQAPRDLTALLVSGAPSPVRHRDEAFFAEAALRARGSPLALTLRDPEAAWREDLSKYALVLLLNVEAPPPDVAARLAQFVEQGGGLFIAMGDRVEPELYNARLGTLLPRPLRLLKSAGRPGTAEGAAKLGEIRERHPVFALFTGTAQEGLFGARFHRYFLLEPQPAAGGGSAEVLATFDDGAPALVEARRGQGRIALWTSTMDRDWTDLPIRTSYLPLIQRLSAYLTGALQEREPVRVMVGDRAAILPPRGQIPARVRTPSGAELAVAAQPDGDYRTAPLPEPGLYVPLDAAGQPLPGLHFVATLDPSESDLTRILPQALSRSWGQDVVVTSARQAARPPVPLWTWLLLAAAFAFFLEGWILRRA